MDQKKPLEGGRKNDDGKLRMDLVPGYPLMRLAEVYTIGAAKYADDNWRAGISYKRIFAAMLRHAWKWFMGESFDPDGQHHLSSVAWGAFTLMEYEITRPEFDDRPKTVATHKNLEMKKPTAAKEQDGLNLKQDLFMVSMQRSGFGVVHPDWVKEDQLVRQALAGQPQQSEQPSATQQSLCTGLELADRLLASESIPSSEKAHV